MEHSPAPAGSPVPVPQPGDVIQGKYRIEKVLGEGGMGVVLAAHHELLDQRVAVKVLTSSDQKAISRFSLEAQSTARLNSEHVARVMDVGALSGGAPFMVMEYLEGCDLEELLHLNGRLPPEEAVGYVLQALDGLAQAHALGIVHRDLKPANLFLTALPSGASIVKIVDFGISKSTASRRSGKTGVLTAEHSTVGSPTYMAPEQIRASKDVDSRADLWSLGVVLYELILGKPPFSGESVGEIFAAVLEKTPPALQTLVPEIPIGLSDAVAKCMSRDVDKRHADVLELAREIAPFGPPDSEGRVIRIEQTLRAVKAKALTPTGSHEIRIEVEPPTGETPVPSSPRRKGPAQATAGHAFSSDAPRPGRQLVATSPSLARQARSRRALRIGGAAGVAGVLGIVALVRGSVSSPASLTVASANRAPAATSASTDVASAIPAPNAAPPPPDVAHAIAVEELPPVKSKPAATQPAPAGVARRAPPTTSPPKKHFSVLDSPD